MRRTLLAVVLAVVSVTLFACGSSGDTHSPTTSTRRPEVLTPLVIQEIPHDRDAFTEGFLFSADGRLWESVGHVGKSAIRELSAETGTVIRESPLAADEFGEGIAEGPDGVVQLTWKNGVAKQWDLESLTVETVFAIEGEGWGLTFDTEQQRFFQSDGSGQLRIRDRDTFAQTGTLTVTRNGKPTDELNELEWVDGQIYANVWHSDEILRIDPTSGVVTAVVDASQLWTSSERDSEMTLNGIAHRPGDPPNRLWLTGKNWPSMFIVDLPLP